MKRIVAAFALLVAFAVGAFGIDGSVAEARGSVAYRTSDGVMERLTRGDVVPEEGTIITAFNSEAVVEFPGWTMTVAPLSRIDVLEQRTTRTERSTRVALPFGRVETYVEPSEDVRVDFRVISPVSTASVRGTEFVYDGVVLRVLEGDVAIENNIGQTHSVRAGQTSRAFGTEPITSVETTLRESALLD